LEKAGKELRKLDPGQQAALVDAFGRVGRGTQKRDEDEDLPIGKAKKLRAVRQSYQGASLRLIYARVRMADDDDKGEVLDPDPDPDPSDEPVPREERVLALHLGLLAWSKKRNDMPTETGETAWRRLQTWLEANEGWEQC
jgi:hypothetical protein